MRPWQEMTQPLPALDAAQRGRTDIGDMNNSLKLVPLSWIERRFLLVDGNGEIGRLEFERALSTRARGAAGGQEWIFERNGILHPVLTVRAPGDAAELLVIPMTFGGGCAITLEERIWRWKTANILRGELAWIRDGDGAQILYRPKMNGFTTEHQIEIAANGVPAETVRFLLFLGAYLAVQACTDTAAVTAVLLATAAVG